MSEEKSKERCPACMCMWCSGTGTNEWDEQCDCTYTGPEHTFDNKCIFTHMGYFGAPVLKHPAEILRLELGVPGGIFVDVILPFVSKMMGDEEEE